MSYKVTRALVLLGAVVLAGLAFPRPANAVEKVTASVAVTNAAGTTNGQTITVNGDVRTWTNNVVVSLSQVLTNSAADGAKTNLYKQIGLSPFFQVNEVDAGSTNLQLIGNSGVALTVTLSAGWGSLSYSTQTVANAIDVPVDYTVLSPAQRTNVTSGLMRAIRASENTNLFFQDRLWIWSPGNNLAKLYLGAAILGGKTNTITSEPAGIAFEGPWGSVEFGNPCTFGADILLGDFSIRGTKIAINTNGFFGDGSGLTNVPSSALVGSAWLLSGNNATASQFLGTTNQAALRFLAYSNEVARFDTNNAIRFGRGHTIETNTAFDSIIAGGYSNVISKAGVSSPTTAAIVGGNNNTNQGAGSFIGAGFNNFISDVATTAVIAGGNGNTNAGISSFVCGYGNSLYAFASFLGGHGNLICPSSGTIGSFIGGGTGNYIGTNANGCVLVGGQFNNISNNVGYSFLGGGYQNTIGPNAADAVVPGGFQNKADAFFAFAAGQRAKAIHQGAFVWSDSQNSDYSSSAPDTFNIRANGGTFIDGPLRTYGIHYPRYANASLANGNNAGVSIGTNTFVEVSGPSGAFTINGIAMGLDGKFLIVLNQTGQNMTIAHESGVEPTAANRIVSMTGADRTTTGNGAATLIYSAAASRWILISFDP